jgi:hypothetical protein
MTSMQHDPQPTIENLEDDLRELGLTISEKDSREPACLLLRTVDDGRYHLMVSSHLSEVQHRWVLEDMMQRIWTAPDEPWQAGPVDAGMPFEAQSYCFA